MLPCQLKPFQVIPYRPQDPSTKFTVEIDGMERLLNCYLLTGERAPGVKFPGNTADVNQEWLDESYVNFTVSNKDLYFKVC